PEHAEVLRLHRHRKNVLRLTGPAIESRQFTADDDVWIKRISNDITIFLRRNGTPVAKRDLAFIAAAFDYDRTAFLLPAVKPIGKRVIRADMIQLRCRLVIPRAPALAAVHSDDRALIRAEQNDLRIVRIDPNILIIVATGRAAPTVPSSAAV